MVLNKETMIVAGVAAAAVAAVSGYAIFTIKKKNTSIKKLHAMRTFPQSLAAVDVDLVIREKKELEARLAESTTQLDLAQTELEHTKAALRKATGG